MRLAWWADPRVPMAPRERGKRARDAALMAIAWRVPRRLAMWCAVRVICHATQGEYEQQIVPDLLATEALDRWDHQASAR